jgi:hypothetical protein
MALALMLLRPSRHKSNQIKQSIYFVELPVGAACAADAAAA